MASVLRHLAVVVLLAAADAATITISNNCAYTVWPAALPGGGEVLGTGESWSIHVPAGTRNGRVWGRTGCGVISNNRTRLGQCQTGDCGGTVACGSVGAEPVTVAEYSLGDGRRGGADDHFGISLVHGFNAPMSFLPRRDGGDRRCAGGGPSCPVQEITFNCPSEQRRVAGCGNPCDGKGGGCGPSKGTEYLKKACPQTITYPRDTRNTIYTCPAGTNYVITFCP